MENNPIPEKNTFLNNTLKIPNNIINQFQPLYTSQNYPIQTNLNVNVNFINNDNNNTNNLFKCEFCTKSYLSNTALRNHMFNKHTPNIKKLKAGRPRQNVDEDNYDIINYNYMRNKYAKFWFVQKRKFSGIINMEKVLNTVFENLYIKYGHLLYNGTKIKNWREHPWLKLLITSNDINIDKYKISCDFALKDYVNQVKEKTNENYLIFIIKFLVLLRECFNFSKSLLIKKPIVNNVERSTIISADQIPEISNEFFTDFLTKKNFFENSIDLNELTEMTELIQHLCYFLHLKDYTSLKLVLIDKEIEK